MPEPFSLSSFLPYRLAVLSERVSRRLAVEYERLHGLSIAEWRVLVHVQRAGSASVRDIHIYANLDKPKVSRAVARLETAGLLSKKTGDHDGRLVKIALTPKGAAALADILPVVTQIEDRLMAALTEDETQALNRVMEKLHQVLDDDPAARPRSRLDLTSPAPKAAERL